MSKKNPQRIYKSTLENVLNDFQQANFSYLVESKLRGSFREENFHLGFHCAIECLKEYFKFKNDIDFQSILKYI